MLRILEIAIAEIGTQEDANHTNMGAAKKYQDAVGLPHNQGFPWCASFVYWCGKEAYGDANPIPKTGGVLDAYNKAVMAEYEHIDATHATPENVKIGAQGIMDFGGGLGHTFLVESVEPNGVIHTIEGNSNAEGGRDGYEVCRRTRHIRDGKMKAFINYPYPDSIA